MLTCTIIISQLILQIYHEGNLLFHQVNLPGLKQSFQAPRAGWSDICFHVSDGAEREIELVILRTHPALKAGWSESNDPVLEALEMLHSSVTALSADQKYLKMRERSHKAGRNL